MNITNTTNLIYKTTQNETISGVLILDTENPRISLTTHYFLKNCLIKGQTSSTTKSTARSLRLLYDYYLLIALPNLTPTKRKTFLEDFAIAFYKRNILNWDSLPDSVFIKAEPHIKAFAHWVSKHSYLLKETEEQDFANLIKESYDFLHMLGKSKLFHQKTNKYSQLHEGNKSERVAKSFPVNKIMDLINHATNPRDKILYILLAFGGRRLLDTLHLMVDDFKMEDRFRVIMGDPIDSMIKGKKRIDYLKDFNLVPRQMMNNSFRVGWRGMRFEDNKRLESKIIFIGAVEQYLYELHIEYMSWRKQFTHHPFYFCSQNGDPLKEGIVHSNFVKDCRKVGLKLEKRIKDGSTTLGLRQFYGYYCSKILQLDDVIVQRLIGYTNVKFVKKFHLDKGKVFKELQGAMINE